MDKKLKQYRPGFVRAIPKEAKESREIDFVISSEAVDRYNTIIKIDGWHLDNYMKNPIIGYQHNVYGGDLCQPPNPDDVIGLSEVKKEDKLLTARALFETGDINPKAEKIFQKLLFGSLRSASVGFMEMGEGIMNEETKTYTFTGQELLEWSVVNIPANPDAAKRHFRTTSDNAVNYIMGVLGNKYTAEEVEGMKISHVMQLIQNRFFNIEDERETQAELRRLEGEKDSTLLEIDKCNLIQEINLISY
mgnify:FL=1